MRSTVLRITVLSAIVLVAVASVASAGVLSSTRFKALEAVYAAIEPVNDSPEAPTNAQLAAVAEACAKLDTGDGLLSSQRRVCTTAVGFLRASTAVTCKSKDACVRQLRAVHVKLREHIEAATAGNTKIDEAVKDDKCGKALRISAKQIAAYKTILSGFREMRDGLDAGAGAQYQRGQARVTDTKVPHKENPLEDFRRACD